MQIGMKTVGDLKDIPEDNASAMQDMQINDKGSFSTRDHFTKKSTLSLGVAVLGLYGYTKREGGTQMIIACNGTDIDTV